MVKQASVRKSKTTGAKNKISNIRICMPSILFRFLFFSSIVCFRFTCCVCWTIGDWLLNSRQILGPACEISWVLQTTAVRFACDITTDTGCILSPRGCSSLRHLSCYVHLKSARGPSMFLFSCWPLYISSVRTCLTTTLVLIDWCCLSIEWYVLWLIILGST